MGFDCKRMGPPPTFRMEVEPGLWVSFGAGHLVLQREVGGTTAIVGELVGVPFTLSAYQFHILQHYVDAVTDIGALMLAVGLAKTSDRPGDPLRAATTLSAREFLEQLGLGEIADAPQAPKGPPATGPERPQ